MERRIDNGDGVDDDQDLRIGGALRTGSHGSPCIAHLSFNNRPCFTKPGSSDFDGCLNALADMDVLRAKSTMCVPTPPCPFNGVNLPPLRGDFVAVSEFWYGHTQLISNRTERAGAHVSIAY